MSRYKIDVRHKILTAMPHAEAWAGWDNPLQTFFGQVLDPDIPVTQEEAVFWIGTSYAAITTVEELCHRLREWATVPGEVLGQLQKEYDARTAPTIVQLAAEWLFSRIKRPHKEG